MAAFRTESVLDIFGAVLLLAAIGLVVRNPEVITVGGNQFNRALGTAVRG